MVQNKKIKTPEIILQEVPDIDFRKQIKPLDKKRQFLKTLKQDISFISVVSIALFAVLGNVSVYMLQKNPPSITFIPKQINLSENIIIKNTAQIAAKDLLNFNYENMFSESKKQYFYKDNFEQWKSALKQSGNADKVINNKGSVTTSILSSHIVYKNIANGMVRNFVTIPFSQDYQDSNEKTQIKGRMLMVMVENPDQAEQFLISSVQVMNDQTISTTNK